MQGRLYAASRLFYLVIVCAAVKISEFGSRLRPVAGGKSPGVHQAVHKHGIRQARFYYHGERVPRRIVPGAHIKPAAAEIYLEHAAAVFVVHVNGEVLIRHDDALAAVSQEVRYSYLSAAHAVSLTHVSLDADQFIVAPHAVVEPSKSA